MYLTFMSSASDLSWTLRKQANPFCIWGYLKPAIKCKYFHRYGLVEKYVLSTVGCIVGGCKCQLATKPPLLPISTHLVHGCVPWRQHGTGAIASWPPQVYWSELSSLGNLMVVRIRSNLKKELFKTYQCWTRSSEPTCLPPVTANEKTTNGLCVPVSCTC